MFLLFIIILMFCAWFWGLFKDWNRERKNKERSIEQGRDFYVDRYNNYVDIKTDVPYKIVGGNLIISPGGKTYTDVCKVHARTGKIIENLTQKVRDELAQERIVAKRNAILNGEKYYVYEKKTNRWPGINCGCFEFQVNSKYRTTFYTNDTIWADVDTNQQFFLYCVHTIYHRAPKTCFANVLIDIKTGKIVRIVDPEKYTEDELYDLWNLINEINGKTHDIYDWHFISGYDWPRELHVR